jgi:hypothetical protein
MQYRLKSEEFNKEHKEEIAIKERGNQNTEEPRNSTVDHEKA